MHHSHENYRKILKAVKHLNNYKPMMFLRLEECLSYNEMFLRERL